MLLYGTKPSTIQKETQERNPDVAKLFEEMRDDFQLEEDKELTKSKLLKLKHEWGKVYDYLAKFNRLTRAIGCTEEQRKGILNYQVLPSVQKEFMKLEADNPTKIFLKDLTRCLIRCDIDQKRYHDERLEKRDSQQENRALVAALLGIYSTKYRIFVNEKEREDINRKENGKSRNKQFFPSKEKNKEDNQGEREDSPEQPYVG